jgi:hypothetical protein
MRLNLIILAVILAVASTAAARESTALFGARYYGMGGCFVASADDRSLLFANPAALDRVDQRMITVFGLMSTVNSRTMDVASFALDNRKKFEDLDDMTEEEQNAFFDDILDNINFKRANVMLSAEPFAWIQRSVGGAIFTDSRVSAMAFGGAGGTPLVEMVGTQDAGGIIGYAHGWTGLQSFLPNRLSAGASVKYIKRWAYSARETITELSDSEGAELLSGGTFGLDVGLLYDLNDKTRLGLAVYDLFATDIEWDGDSSDVSRIQPGDMQEIDPALRLGVTRTLSPQAGFLASPILLAFDLAEPFDGDVTFFKKLHLGAEASLFKPWFKARVGLSQGYLSAGLGLWMFSYAYYAEEEGRHAGQIQDHRHVISFGL